MKLLALQCSALACEIAELGIAADAKRVFLLCKNTGRKASEARAAESPTAVGGNFQMKNIFLWGFNKNFA